MNIAATKISAGVSTAQSLKIKGSALFLCSAIYFHYQTPKACFPRICTAFPRTQKRSRCNAVTSGGIFEDISPKVGTSSQVGASKSGLTQPGSCWASQFCDSAIMQTGQRVIIEIHSILRASNTSAILRRSMAVRQIDPLAACVDADTFLCWGAALF